MEEPNQPENRNINTGGGNYNERIEGDYIEGNLFKRIIFSIFQWTNNIFIEQTLAPVGNPIRPKNEQKLLDAVKYEVTVRLKNSLHNTVLINLGKELQPQQVKLPCWYAEIKNGLKPAEPLPDTTTIYVASCSLPKPTRPLELRPFPRLLHRSPIPPTCRRTLPLHPQTIARPLRPNGV